jgi:hypothetical protein
METPVLLGIILSAASLSLLAIRTGGREMFKRRKQLEDLAQQAEQERTRKLIEESHIPDGSSFVFDNTEVRWSGLPLPGSLMLVCIGTPGMNRGRQFLSRLDYAGLSSAVGSILVINFDLLELKKFQQELPAVYQNWVVYAYAPEFGSGFGNRLYEEVKRDIGYYGVTLQEKTREAVNLHERRTGFRPGEILMETSPGGHNYPGVLVAQTLHLLVPKVEIIATIDLPGDEPMRDDFLKAKPEYEVSGVYGWIVSDAFEFHSVTADTALTDLLVGIYAASLQGDTSPRLNNILKRVLPEGKGGVAVYQFLYSQVVAHRFQPHQSVPARYYAHLDQVVAELKTLMGYMEAGNGISSVRAPLGETKRATYDLVLTAYSYQHDVLAVADYLKTARQLEADVLPGNPQHGLFNRPNYHTLHASYIVPIDPNEPCCQVAVIRLRALHNWKQNFSELAKPPAERQFRVAEQPLIRTRSTNGVEDVALTPGGGR